MTLDGLPEGQALPYFGLTGPKAAEARAKDATVKRLKGFRTQPGTPGYRELLEGFKASPLTGCTTVLDQLRRKAEYVPSRVSFVSLAMFQHWLLQSPLFREQRFDAFDFEIKVGMGQPTPDPDAVIRRFQSSDAIASARIRQHYETIMRAAISNPGKTQEGDLLQEHSLGVGDRISFLYIRTSVKANIGMLPGMIPIGSILGDRRGMEFVFETAKWPEYAERVLQEDLKTLDDFLDGL